MVSDLVFLPARADRTAVAVPHAPLGCGHREPAASASDATQARCHHRASAPATRNRFLASPTSPTVRACEQAAAGPRRPPPPATAADHLPRGDARARSTPRSISAPIPTVPIVAGSGCGNIRANGHPSGGPWRQLHCTACEGYFLETHGTPLHGKRVAPDLLVWAVGALAEGLGHPRRGPGVRGRPQHGAAVVGRGRGPSPGLLAVFPARRARHAGATGRTLCPAQCGQGRRGQRGRGHHSACRARRTGCGRRSTR